MIRWLYTGCAAAAVAVFAYVPERPLAVGLALVLVLATLVMLVSDGSRANAPAARGTTDLRWRDEGWDVLGREIQEHRRYERTLAVCRIPATDVHLQQSAKTNPAAVFAAALWPHLRVGASAYVDQNDVVLILPSTDRSDTQMMLNRLERALGVDGLRETAAVATFPDDALTAGALIESVSAASARQAQLPAEPVHPLPTAATGLSEPAPSPAS